MKNIQFSILIPSYKKDYLKEAIESCLKQTYSNFEIIIINDKSPYNLKDIVEQFNSSKIKYYENDSNIGPEKLVNNWNKGLNLCNGDYIICMGDDDRLTPCCLECYNNIICQYPTTKLIHGWTEIIDENGNFLEITSKRPDWESAISLAWHRWNGRNKQYIGDWCFSITELRKIGGFYMLPLAWASDDITAILCANDSGVRNSQVICFQYRENSKTISNTGNSVLKMRAIKQEEKWYMEFLEASAHSEDDEKFRLSMKRQLSSHFYYKKRDLVENDLKSKGSLVFWLKFSRECGLSKLSIIRAYLPKLFKRNEQ